MISLQNIQYSIGKKRILNNVSTEWLPGSVTVLLGPNGSGKSTLLKIASGITKGYSGTALLDGIDLLSASPSVLAIKRAVMRQQSALSFPLLVEEVVMMGRYPHFTLQPTKKDLDTCAAIVTMLGLTPLLQRNYLTLSGGEQQRVQFARVLAQVWDKPAAANRYLFLDEPTSSLDIRYQHAFLQLASTMAHQGFTVVAVLHDINLALQYADYVLLLKDGAVLRQGKPADIIDASVLQEVFGIRAALVRYGDNRMPMVVYQQE